ncbi:TPA: hypothetical protein DIV55_06455 [Patescibacteria group bacterium]|uniref:Secreted protein n=1 Tax=Candidatus Curtissbacteria bacterium GW2011_GWA1_40_16 TaxID=1618405 RepID=A0A0G0REK9_9BACT|nr:MAG: hypothetical protein UT84_C0005G0019 [Candidatus Curtissbacteria bacterium GW2011_GWA1_40_16]HCS79347.1 hypothetical protein [Patescibacteria group bacterium]
MKKITAGFTSVLAIASLVVATPVLAATVISPSAQGSWDFQTNNLVDGVGRFVTGPSTPPLGSGSVELSSGTNGSTFSAIHNTSYAGQPITLGVGGVSASYSTYVPGGASAPSYPKLIADIVVNTATGSLNDELAFDPRSQTSQTPTAGIWQTWDAKNGIWTWNLCGGGTGTLQQYVTNCLSSPSVVSVAVANRTDGTGGIRLQVGPNASSDQLDGFVDNVTLGFDGTSTTYDFEDDTIVLTTPTNKDECNKGGWQNFNSPVFKNQGSCVSFVEANANAGK